MQIWEVKSGIAFIRAVRLLTLCNTWEPDKHSLMVYDEMHVYGFSTVQFIQGHSVDVN